MSSQKKLPAKAGPSSQHLASSADDTENESRMAIRSNSTSRRAVSRTQKRKRQKVDRTSVAGKASAKNRKTQKPRQNKTKVIDRTFIYEDNEVERPTMEDFTLGTGRLRIVDYHKWQRGLGNTVLKNPNVLEPPKPLSAPPPGLPDPRDDEPDLATVEIDITDNGKDNHRAKSVRPKTIQKKVNSKTTRSISDETPWPEDEPEQVLEQVPAMRKARLQEPPNFMNIPVEIRDKLYRELLVINMPIKVHGGWRLVYKRNKLCLPTSILRVCRQVHAESSRVLYGENTFLYRLRDPTIGVKNIDRLALDDEEAPEVDEGDSGSEWEGERRAPLNNCPGRKRSAKKPEWDINIDKYSRLFRSIAVEAEHNRYSEDTQDSMAKAINVFAQRPMLSRGRSSSKGGFKSKFNIRNLTIRVTPLWNPTGGGDGEGAFTFVDFFKPKSPVLEAMKAVECQFLRIDLLTRYMGKSPATPAENGACRLTVDRRYHRLYNMLIREKGEGRGEDGGSNGPEADRDDWWVEDRVMQHRRKDLARKSVEAMDMMAVHVERECVERDFEQRTTEDCVTGRDWLFWDEISGEEDDV